MLNNRGVLNNRGLLNNKGSLTVFLAVIFLGIFLLAGLILDTARIMLAENKVEAALQTSARSVLAGCDRELAGEFGLYGVNNLDTAKAREYFAKNLQERHPQFRFVRYNVTDFELGPQSDASLAGKDALRSQIIQYMQIKGPLLIGENILDMLRTSGLKQKTGDFARGRTAALERTDEEEMVAEKVTAEGLSSGSGVFKLSDIKELLRMLQDPALLKTIQTRDLAGLAVAEENSAQHEFDDMSEESGKVTELLQKVCRLATESALESRDRLYQIEYIMDKFTFLTSATLRDHYFGKGEVEYILWGGTVQAANLAAVAGEVFFLRFSLDALYRFATSAQAHPVSRLAEALTLGFKDAGADLRKLYNGEGITLFPASLPGYHAGGSLGYADHLRLLLLLQDREVQLARVQELIQVNLRTMKGEEKKTFLLRDTYQAVQLSACAEINLWFLPLLHPEKLGLKNFLPNGYRIEKNAALHY